MKDVAELKNFAAVHAHAQGIRGLDRLLAGITDDDEGSPQSWAERWTAAGDVLRGQGRLLEAVRYYTMARFPYIDGPGRRRAHDLAVRTFARWAPENGLERIELELPGGRVVCWATGLSARRPRPLVITCGGIVSPKEQWAPALAAVRRFGFAAVVLEMPGVGENTQLYDTDSWRLLPALLDAIGPAACTRQTYAMSLSFSGHLALRAAAEDRRIRGVVTVGAPVAAFFTDQRWISGLPKLTLDTLAHHTGLPAGNLPEALAPWALSDELLAGLDIPVGYTASLRDEIIPPADPALLRAQVRRLDLRRYDDVHGSPSHIGQIRLWALASILRMHGVRDPRALAIRVAQRAATLTGHGRRLGRVGPQSSPSAVPASAVTSSRPPSG